MSKEENADVRFNNMMTAIFTLFDEYKPCVVCIEDTALQRNAKTLKELAQLQGAIIGYCRFHTIDIQIIKPSSWRKQLNFTQGKGVKRPELKKQCFQWVKENIGIERSEDEVEAIGIGAALLKMWKNK